MKPETLVIAGAVLVLLLIFAFAMTWRWFVYSESVEGRIEISRDVEQYEVDLAGAACIPGGESFNGIDLEPGEGPVRRLRVVRDAVSGSVLVLSLAGGDVLELTRERCEVLDDQLVRSMGSVGGWLSADGSVRARCAVDGWAVVAEFQVNDCS